MKYIKTNDLFPTMLIAQNLYDADNRLLLTANTSLTGRLIAHIKNLGFHGVYVLHEAGDRAYSPLLDDEARQEAIRSLKGLDTDQIRYVANSISNQVLHGSDRLYDMMTVCAYDDLTYMHSVNVTVLSVMIGVSLGLDNGQLLELGQAALLHDIGKTLIDPRIIKKPGRLTEEEFEAVKTHPRLGYELLKSNPGIPESVRQGVLSHHECENGTGYPNGIFGAYIGAYAKIIHVADVYDAMVSKRAYKERMNPADVLEHLYAGAGTVFDAACVNALKDTIALYPDGVLVSLSNGMEGYVQKNHKGFPTRPDIRTATGTRIDLMTHLNITVTGILDGCP